MDDLLTRPTVILPLALLTCYLFYALWQLIWPSYLPDLPVVGSRSSDWFPLLQARWRNSTNYEAVAKELDTIYKSRPCLVPIGGSETIVLLPDSETQRIADQPSSILNMSEPMNQGLQFKYTIHNPVVLEKPIHYTLVTGNLTRQIANLVPSLLDETESSFEAQWGVHTTEYKELPVYDTLRRVIGRATNRAFVGLPACRNPGLVDAGMGYAGALPREAKGLRVYPNFVKPLVASYYTKETKAHTEAFHQILYPEIQKRLQESKLRHEDGSIYPDLGPEENDLLQWLIKQAVQHPDPQMLKSETLAGRILMLNFAAIHTTSFTITHAVFDLFSSEQRYVDDLRAEVESCLAANGNQGWCQKALSGMTKLDSLIRESMRLNMASTFGIPRLVVGDDCYVTGMGMKISRGNIIAVAGKNIARDDRYYEEAEKYKPFRFAPENGGSSNAEKQKDVRMAAATTCAEYLPFGHGKHACPGRFFAGAVLKLTLAYMLVHYDVQMLEKRPPDIFAGVSKLPPLASTLKIRRRL